MDISGLNDFGYSYLCKTKPKSAYTVNTLTEKTFAITSPLLHPRKSISINKDTMCTMVRERVIWNALRQLIKIALQVICGILLVETHCSTSLQYVSFDWHRGLCYPKKRNRKISATLRLSELRAIPRNQPLQAVATSTKSTVRKSFKERSSVFQNISVR